MSQDEMLTEYLKLVRKEIELRVAHERDSQNSEFPSNEVRVL